MTLGPVVSILLLVTLSPLLVSGLVLPATKLVPHLMLVVSVCTVSVVESSMPVLGIVHYAGVPLNISAVVVIRIVMVIP